MPATTCSAPLRSTTHIMNIVIIVSFVCNNICLVITLPMLVLMLMLLVRILHSHVTWKLVLLELLLPLPTVTLLEIFSSLLIFINLIKLIQLTVVHTVGDLALSWLTDLLNC